MGNAAGGEHSDVAHRYPAFVVLQQLFAICKAKGQVHAPSPNGELQHSADTICNCTGTPQLHLQLYWHSSAAFAIVLVLSTNPADTICNCTGTPP